MSNIQFNYLYRDGANYKNYGVVVFANPAGLPCALVNTIIQKQLIDGDWFYAQKWRLKDLHFPKWDDEIDVLWHEYDSVEETDEPPTDERTISEFLRYIVKTANGILVG